MRGSGGKELKWTYAVDDHQGIVGEGGLEFCFAGIREGTC